MTTAWLSSRLTKLATAAALAGALSACAMPGGAPGEREARIEANDPLEPLNRASFAIHETLDQYLLGPVTDAYRYVTPQIAQDIVHNVVRNLLGPITIVHNLLQGNVDGATKATGRFLTNTVLGAGGIVDVAAEVGNPFVPEDLGQTLAVWGVGEGPYLFLPLLGPSNVRDLAGFLVDSVADPINNYARVHDYNKFLIEKGGASAVDRRASLGPVIDDLRKNSVDYYATVRASYHQQRQADITGVAKKEAQPEFPVFEPAPAAKPAPAKKTASTAKAAKAAPAAKATTAPKP